MSESITLTTLVENCTHRAGLFAEHGLSFLVRTRTSRIVFDTGQSGLLVENARLMGLNLDRANAVVLSHGHYDHTGGLAAVGAISPDASIFLHPDAMDSKFSKAADGTSRFIGIPSMSMEFLKGDAAFKIVWTREAREVTDGVWVTGEIPRRSGYEDAGGPFYLNSECTVPDPLLDDQALFFEVRGGIVVVLGCGHSGIVNTLDHISRLTNGQPFRSVLGGMHLLAASPERMDRTIEALRQWNIPKLVPAHCTGMSAVARLWAAFPNRCASCPVGTSISFELVG